ncbi:MAG: hypothetical protein V3V18_11065 [Methylococcales bacterium]
MRIARFHLYPEYCGIFEVYGSAEAEAELISYELTDSAFIDYFQLCRPDLVYLFVIGDRTGNTYFDIRLDEPVPAAKDVVHTAQMPFLVKGDQVSPEGEKGIIIGYEEYRSVDIPPGNYLLTVHQCFGKYPLGYPENASEEDKKSWPCLPTRMRMWFNRVDNLDEQVAESRWHHFYKRNKDEYLKNKNDG